MTYVNVFVYVVPGIPLMEVSPRKHPIEINIGMNNIETITTKFDGSQTQHLYQTMPTTIVKI